MPKQSQPQAPFRFRDLPLEIRNEIYHLCLVDDVEVAIETDIYPSNSKLAGDDSTRIWRWLDGVEVAKADGSHSHSKLAGDDDVPIRLVHRHYSHTPRTWNSNLLFVDRATHEEAAIIYYGLNEFRFRGLDRWRNLNHFLSTLPRHSRTRLRRLELPFPYIEKRLEGSSLKVLELHPDVLRGMEMIKGLPKLQTLTFNVARDIMSSDQEHILSIARLQGENKIVLRINERSIGIRGQCEGRLIDSRIKISAAVVQLLHDCSWGLVGTFETIDQQHLFGNELLWLRWIQACHRTPATPLG